MRGSGLSLKREQRREGVREGIRVLREGSFRQRGRERMVKIWVGREEEEEEKGLRWRRREKKRLIYSSQ